MGLILKNQEGIIGTDGAPGSVGPPGPSAYDAAVSNGFVGTEAERLDTLGGNTDIQFEDEGLALGTAGTVETVDFTGAGVTASRVGDKVTVTIPGGGGGGVVDSVNGQTGIVVLDADDIDDTATAHKFVTSTDLTKLSNLSGTNSGDVTVTDSSEIDFTLTGQDITASLINGSIVSTKLSAGVSASLGLANTALQSGSNISLLANDAGYTTNVGTVTSVAVTGSDGLEVDSGSPITTNGTIAIGVNKTSMLTHLNVEDGAEVNNISDANATDLTDGGNTTLHTHDGRYYTETETDTLLSNKINTSEKGANNGVAELDGTGKVPSAQLPSFVDDVIVVANFAALPVTGEIGKIYITEDTNLTYRWNGSGYTEISASLALGETSSTAYRGDRGKIAYDHSQVVTGNPHSVTKTEVGLGNVDNTSDLNKPVSTATQTALNAKLDDSQASAFGLTLLDDADAATARATLGLGTLSTQSGTFSGTSSGTNTGDQTADTLAESATKVFVSPTEKTAITHTNRSDLDLLSGTNTGDNAVNTLYSGLVTNATHTGDVTGATALTIANDAVTNAKLANMATKTYKGRTAGGTGDPEDVPVATLKTDLALTKGDVGLGNVDNTSDATKNSAVATLTNKRITKRVGTTASGATVTINSDNFDGYTVTALATNTTIAAPTGTPTEMQSLMIRIKDNGTTRTIARNAAFRAIGVTLPGDTTVNKTIYVGAFWNVADSKWDVTAVGEEA